MEAMADRYHHGDLRAAFLRRAAAAVARSGAQAVSLRALAAEEGVSHTAPRHHFGSRDGLLTALAAEGFELLADALWAVREGGGTFAEVGVAYVEFALAHPGHFGVMFDADVLIDTDPALVSAQERAFAEVRVGVDSVADPRARQDVAAATVAGWALMHGLVVLDRGRALERSHVAEVLERPALPDLAARVAGMLFGSPGSAS